MGHVNTPWLLDDNQSTPVWLIVKSSIELSFILNLLFHNLK
ncbi:hypothetical protein P20480_1920 [Pseudoalteromonas sp. BSi20480]|nr:hypothetical protein P20480_1920 [Pseudoalteromonas sp. BSi20480]